MDLSKIKMVVSDMDGTLLNSKHEVSHRFFSLFEELKRRGILFVAASGRQYNSMVDKLHPIKDDIIIIAENGGYVMQNEKELLSTPLDGDILAQLLPIVEKINGAHPVLCGKTNAYLKNNCPEFVDKLREYYTEYVMLDDLTRFDGEILKIAIYHFKSSEKYIYPSVQYLKDILKVKVSGKNWLDLSHQNAHKGFALQKIQEEHNISPMETLVFGDYNNDLEMLALSYHSFAMANAHPNVLKAARYSTLSNDDFGVELILEKLLQANRY